MCTPPPRVRKERECFRLGKLSNLVFYLKSDFWKAESWLKARMPAHGYELLNLILGASPVLRPLSPDSEAFPQPLLWALHLGTPAQGSDLLSHPTFSDGFTHSSSSAAPFRKPSLIHWKPVFQPSPPFLCSCALWLGPKSHLHRYVPFLGRDSSLFQAWVFHLTSRHNLLTHSEL